MALKTAVVQSSDEQAITAQEVTDIKTSLALENVDNTSDQNKPISTAQQNALDNKVDKEVGKGLSDENYTLAEKQNLANQSGTNTGDQDISGIAVNTNAINDIEQEQINQNNAISLNTAKRSYPLADENKLATIEANATENQTDAFLLDRANHTGRQNRDTIINKTVFLENYSSSISLAPENTSYFVTLAGNIFITPLSAIPTENSSFVHSIKTYPNNNYTVSFPNDWDVYGNFDPTKINKLTIEVAYNTGFGFIVDIFINQPN